MKKKVGAKNCGIGANCKSTCIANSKNCIINPEAGRSKISSAVSKIKGGLFPHKQLDNFITTPTIPKANLFLAELFKDSSKQNGYGAEVTGKNAGTISTAIKDFQTATGANIRLNKVEEKPIKNSSADRRAGLINIAEQPNPAVARKQAMHELGHYLGQATPENIKAEKDYIVANRTSDKPELLSKLTGSNAYRLETAYPGTWSDPYIGKVYISGATEVLSKASENLASGKDLVAMFEKDRPLFDVLIGAIKRGRS